MEVTEEIENRRRIRANNRKWRIYTRDNTGNRTIKRKTTSRMQR